MHASAVLLLSVPMQQAVCDEAGHERVAGWCAEYISSMRLQQHEALCMMQVAQEHGAYRCEI